MALKEKVQTICKAKGIPTYKVEEDCGFAKGYISKLDKSAPSTDKIKKIADYLDVSIDYLLDRDKFVNYSVDYIYDDGENQHFIELETKIKNDSAFRALMYAALLSKDKDLEFARQYLERMKDRI